MRDPSVWEGLLDRSINAFYEGELAEGQLACDQLLCMPDLPQNVRAITRTNQVHYAQQLQQLIPSYRETAISLPEGADSALRNPSLTTEHTDWIVLCTASQASAPLHESGGITLEAPASTDCILTRLNADLHVVAAPARVLGEPSTARFSGLASGRNGSCHIVRLGEKWVAAHATPPVTAETPGQLALREFIPGVPSFRHEHPLFVIDVDATHSWLPAAHAGELYLVTLRGATSVLGVDLSTSSVTLAAFNDAPYVMHNLRGVSQWVNVDDGFIALTEDEVTWDDGAKSRLYRVVRCDRSFRITHLSHPYRVQDLAAEAGGLAILDGVAALTFVSGGQTLHIAAMDIADVMALLKPVADISPAGAFAFPMPAGLLALLARWAPASAPDVEAVCAHELPILRPETIIERMHREYAVITRADLAVPSPSAAQPAPIVSEPNSATR